MKRIVSYDLARQKDHSCLTISFKNTCLEEMKEMWSTGMSIRCQNTQESTQKSKAKLKLLL